MFGVQSGWVASYTRAALQRHHAGSGGNMKTLCYVLSALLLASTGYAQPCGNYTGPIFLDGFGPPDRSFVEEPVAVLPPEAMPLALTIVAPADGAVVGSETLQVYGSFSGPPAAGVAINRFPAVQTAADFVGLVILEPGENTITVKLTQLTGESITHTRTVNYDPAQQPDVELSAEIQGEHAPIKTGFTLALKPDLGLNPTRLQVDFDGDGSFEVDSTNISAPLLHEYKIPGFFTPTALVTFDGPPLITRSATRKMAVLPLPLTRATLCYVFYRMKNRLGANDINDAVKSVNAELRSEVQADFEALPDPIAAAPLLGTVVDGSLGIRIASLTLSTTYRNRPIATSMQFERSLDGVWRVTDM